MAKVRYTKDKWGCYVFAKQSKLDNLELDNCFIATGEKSVWVFPFDTLWNYMKNYEGNRWGISTAFMTFLKDKENKFIINGKEVRENYCYCCSDKMNAITDNCSTYRCKYKQPDNTPFNINMSKAKFIKPSMADVEHRNCRSVMFTQLCPDIKTEQLNKETSAKRGQKAGLTRRLKSQRCPQCLYRGVCKDRHENENKNCMVSRKMVNRRLRQRAEKRFGSFDNLLELMSYVGTEIKEKNNTYEIVFPLSRTEFVMNVKHDREHSYYWNKYQRISVGVVNEYLKEHKITMLKGNGEEFEYKAKVIMLFLELTDSQKLMGNMVLDLKKEKNYSSYRLCMKPLTKAQKKRKDSSNGKYYRPRRDYISKFKYETYNDVLADFGTFRKEWVFFHSQMKEDNPIKVMRAE